VYNKYVIKREEKTKMKNPKFHEKWFVDLSPVVGNELGGIRKCLVDQKISDNLYRVIPYAFNLDNGEEEPMYDHTRTIDISRFRSRCI
jgi:hypothetical protein